MAGPTRLKLSDLQPSDGAPTEAYRTAIVSLWQSLARFNTGNILGEASAIIQLPPGDDMLIKHSLDATRMFFQSHRHASEQPGLALDDPLDWNRSSGYISEPHYGKECYDFRPGATPSHPVPPREAGECSPPECLPEAYACLGNAARVVVEAVGRSLDLRTYAFTDLLDNVPLKGGEMASSVLSLTCHGRRVINPLLPPSPDDSLPPLPEDSDPRAEKGLLALVKPDCPGLYVRDPHNRWLLVDAELGPADILVLVGLSLYQGTGGYVGPSLYRTDVSAAANAVAGLAGNAVRSPNTSNGRFSLVFKLLPRASAIIHCSAMAAAGHIIGTPFQAPVAVANFMTRPLPMDQILATPPKGFKQPKSMEKSRKRKSRDPMGSIMIMASSGGADKASQLAPSKRLRLEAQRVLKEKVQDRADQKQMKIRFCSLKECEELHMASPDPPCGYLRAQLGWPDLVPFVHPHDLPNRGKQAFLEAFEPGWTARQEGSMPPFELGLTPKRSAADRSSAAEKFSARSMYDFLRDNNKAVPTGKPQVVGHKVDLPLLCRLAFDAGGKQRFESSGGFQEFISRHFQLDGATERERERALERLKKLFEQVMAEYVDHLVVQAHLEAAHGGGEEQQQQLLMEGGEGGGEEQLEMERQELGMQLGEEEGLVGGGEPDIGDVGVDNGTGGGEGEGGIVEFGEGQPMEADSNKWTIAVADE